MIIFQLFQHRRQKLLVPLEGLQCPGDAAARHNGRHPKTVHASPSPLQLRERVGGGGVYFKGRRARLRLLMDSAGAKASTYNTCITYCNVYDDTSHTVRMDVYRAHGPRR